MNLTVLLDMAAEGFGDRTIVGHRGGGLTAKRVRELSIGGTRLLRELGVDSVVYVAVNGPAFPIALFAAARAGVPLIPMNYRLGADQLRKLLAHHPNALVLTDTDELTMVGGSSSTVLSTEIFLAEASSRAGDDEAVTESDEPAAIIYTSGTTSQPKGVVIKHANLLSYVFGSVDFASALETDAALISVPPYHIAAIANAVTNIFAGRRTVILEQFAPKTWLSLVRSERVTHALIVPTMLARIFSAADVDRKVPTLRSLAYGGAPMPTRVILTALQAWPEVDFVNAYGLTETSSTIAVLGPEDHRAAIESDDPSVTARLGSVGRVLPSVDVQIRDVFGAVAPQGAVGRIWVRGPQVSGEYAGSASNLDADGWFDTRDEGRIDEDGYLFIGGRTDDTIIRGAENIAPAEIEDVLLAHPAVEDAVVVGVPNEEWGQQIEAAVVLNGSLSVTPHELREYVRERLRSSKTPDRIEIWDELPRTETGKLIRRAVVERFVSADAVHVVPKVARRRAGTRPRA